MGVHGKGTDVMRRRPADFLLLGITAVELALLPLLTPTFALADWIYVSQHMVVLGIALIRRPPQAQDRSLTAGILVAIAYTYSYAQVAYLRWAPGEAAWPEAGLVLVTLAACLSFASLLALGRRFGVRPALRELARGGPYRIVRHPMYLAYVLADIGYNLQEWNVGTALLVLAGWAALVCRIHREEALVSRDAGWRDYAAAVRYRLVPGLW